MRLLVEFTFFIRVKKNPVQLRLHCMRMLQKKFILGTLSKTRNPKY